MLYLAGQCRRPIVIHKVCVEHGVLDDPMLTPASVRRVWMTHAARDHEAPCLGKESANWSEMVSCAGGTDLRA